jgi:oligopeptide transport system ATP-binding protein
MYAGKVIEIGPVQDIFADPKHPYTWGLLGSMPRLDQPEDQELEPIPGSPPDLLDPPKGCAFAARCPYAMKVCAEQMPEMTKISPKHQVACWLTHPDAPKVEKPAIVEAGGVN